MQELFINLMSPSTSLWSRTNRFFFAAHLVLTATVWLMTGSFNQHRPQLQTILHSPHEFSWSPMEIYFSRSSTAASWAQSNVEQETFLDHLTLLALQCIYGPLFQLRRALVPCRRWNFTRFHKVNTPCLVEISSTSIAPQEEGQSQTYNGIKKDHWFKIRETCFSIRFSTEPCVWAH